MVAFRDLFDARLSIQQDLIDGLGEIDPPAEVEEDHKEIVAAGREFVDLLQELNGRLAEVKSVSQVMQLLEEFDPSLTTVDDRFDSARIQLQVVSNLVHGIFINLGCGRGVGRITTASAVASYGFDVDLGCPEVEEEPRPTATAEPDDGVNGEHPMKGIARASWVM